MRKIRAERAPMIEEFPIVGSRALVTIGPDSLAWLNVPEFKEAIGPDVVDAIVRLQPPASATDADVARVFDFVRKVAGAVRVLPRKRLIGHRDATKPAPAPHAQIRQVVAETVDEMTVDKEALGAFVEEVMSRCSL